MSKIQKTSYQLCNRLYSVGFSRNERNFNQQNTELMFKSFFGNSSIMHVVGSYAECTSDTNLFSGSDIDCLFLLHITITDGSLVYTLPGYVKLKKEITETPGELGKGEEIIQNAYYKHSDICLFTKCNPFSSIIVGPASRSYQANNVQFLRNAMHFIFNNTTIEHMLRNTYLPLSDMDIVPAIPYRFKAIMKSWILRRRHHGWPSTDVIKEVSEMPGYLVATGPGNMEKDPNNQFQFRISFTTGEIKLVKSLNETQILVYIFLKQLFKQETRTEKPCMTSYIIKNIILWIAESVSPCWFELRNLFPLIYATLRVMKWMVECKHMIPNYMIPARNMLDEKLDQTQQQELVAKLTSWIQNAKEEKPFGVTDLTGIPDSEPIDDTDTESVNDLEELTQMVNHNKCILNMFLLNPSKEIETYAYIVRYIVKSDDFVKSIELKDDDGWEDLAWIQIFMGLKMSGIFKLLGLTDVLKELKKKNAQQHALGSKEVHDIPLD